MPISGSGSGFLRAVNAAAQGAGKAMKDAVRKLPTGEVEDILKAFTEKSRSLEKELGRHLEKMEAAEATDEQEVFVKTGRFNVSGGGGGDFSGVSRDNFLPFHENTVKLQELFIKKIGDRSISEEKVRALARLIIKIVNNAPKGKPNDKETIEQQTEELVQYVVNNRYDADKLSLIFPGERGEYTTRSLINDTYQKMKQAESFTVDTSGGAEDMSSAQRGRPLAEGGAAAAERQGVQVTPSAPPPSSEGGGAEAKPQEASVTTPSAPPSEGVGEDLGAAVAAPKKQGEVRAVFPSGSAENPLQTYNVKVVESSLHQPLKATIVPPIKNTSPSGSPLKAEGGGAAAEPEEVSRNPSAPAAGGGGEDQGLATAIAASMERGNAGRSEGAAEHDPDLAAGIAASMEAGHEGRPEGAAEDDRALAAALAASLEKGNEGRQLTPLQQALLEARPLKPPKS